MTPQEINLVIDNLAAKLGTTSAEIVNEYAASAKFDWWGGFSISAFFSILAIVLGAITLTKGRDWDFGEELFTVCGIVLVFSTLVIGVHLTGISQALGMKGPAIQQLFKDVRGE